MTGPSPRIAAMLARYEAGDRVSTIAADAGVHNGSVYLAAKRHLGVPRPRQPRGHTPEIIRLRELGLSYREIMERVPVTGPAVSKALEKWRPDLRAGRHNGET